MKNESGHQKFWRPNLAIPLTVVLLSGLGFYVRILLIAHSLYLNCNYDEWSDFMELIAGNKQQSSLYDYHDVSDMLDKGIDDMELKRELPIDEAFQKILELRGFRGNTGV
ncbi:MAG: hypothetical protein ACLTJE_09925 [Enterocloster bolteae]|nr:MULTISPECIES: hypothetical protein [Clostridia]HBF3623791.1 hypothetical protein [Clostridioides difficile]MBC5706132.1 hypothetical protein [Hungatella sp. L36]MBS5243617.1 hypothetical protein [Hungatella hathewayi]MDB2030069.1 hypothetical protein [[Clostridium] symbiosum]MDU1140144.1 hypothetical protein [Enterocloster bolteae]